MKSYDDLQRFKEKTLTNHIEFKDMSEQTKNSDSAGWAIIQQLMNEGVEAGLGNAQRIDVAAPQPLAKDIFSAPAPQAQPVQANHQPQSVQPQSVTAFISAKAAAQPGGSLLETISASLKPAQAQGQAQAVAAEAAPETPVPSAVPQQALFTAIAARPAAALSDEQPRFKQLFSSAPESPQTMLPKETLLQPLLEKIALCR